MNAHDIVAHTWLSDEESPSCAPWFRDDGFWLYDDSDFEVLSKGADDYHPYIGLKLRNGQIIRVKLKEQNA